MRIAAFTDLVGYSWADDLARSVHDAIINTPYIVLVIVAALFLAVFIFGLVKKLIVVTIVVSVLGIGLIALWMYSGHVISLG